MWHFYFRVQRLQSSFCMHFVVYFQTTLDGKNTRPNTCWIFICLCISGSIAIGAAPESSAFPWVNLAALILTAKTVLWQTYAGTGHYSCLLRGETAGQRQQEADSRISTCSLPYPTVSFLFFLQRSLCDEDSFSSTFLKELLKGTGSFRSCSLFEDTFFLCAVLTNGYSHIVFTLEAQCVWCTIGCMYVFSGGTVQVLLNGYVWTTGLFLDDGILSMAYGRWRRRKALT